jgi:hypothetical protein
MATSYLDPNWFTNFLNLNVFTGWYQGFLSLFPPALWWLVSAIVLISIIGAFFVLIRTHWLFLLILIIILPFLIPVFHNFFGEIYNFVLYLWNIIVSGAPKI